MSEMKREWPEGCGYQGYEFGAAYPDSMCSGGRLLDADNCDGNGNIYEPMDEIPCPMCHPRLAVKYWTDQNRFSGMDELNAKAAAWSLVKDIRRNRKNGTEPWKVGEERRAK